MNYEIKLGHHILFDLFRWYRCHRNKPTITVVVICRKKQPLHNPAESVFIRIEEQYLFSLNRILSVKFMYSYHLGIKYGKLVPRAKKCQPVKTERALEWRVLKVGRNAWYANSSASLTSFPELSNRPCVSEQVFHQISNERFSGARR